jgi:hypothetical protein
MLKTLVLALILSAAAFAQSGGPVYELRIYTATEGNLSKVVARFRDHTTKLFEKHGMENVGYWIPTDAPKSQNTLVYILRHKSRDAAKASWDAFRQDPDWIKARTASELSGKLVEKAESTFMSPTDFSKSK